MSCEKNIKDATRNALKMCGISVPRTFSNSHFNLLSNEGKVDFIMTAISDAILLNLGYATSSSVIQADIIKAFDKSNKFDTEITLDAIGLRDYKLDITNFNGNNVNIRARYRGQDEMIYQKTEALNKYIKQIIDEHLNDLLFDSSSMTPNELSGLNVRMYDCPDVNDYIISEEIKKYKNEYQQWQSKRGNKTKPFKIEGSKYSIMTNRKGELFLIDTDGNKQMFYSTQSAFGTVILESDENDKNR